MSDEGKTKKEEKKGKEPKQPKEKGGGNIVVTILLAIMGLLLLAVIGLGVYIFVFPDDWPKPFYVNLEPPAAQAAESTPGPAGAETKPELPTALPLPGEGLMFDTGTKIVNLADPGGRRYLKVAIVLEFAPHDAEFYTLAGEERTAAMTLFSDDMGLKKPIVDDLLNTLISSKTFDEIYTVDGKDALRQDIIYRINILLPSEHLMYVYFTEFVVQ